MILTYSVSGVLIYPGQGRYVAEWDQGRIVKGDFFFEDNLQYKSENWSYLTQDDRRFFEEKCKGFNPQEAHQRSGQKLPAGTYDPGQILLNESTPGSSGSTTPQSDSRELLNSSYVPSLQSCETLPLRLWVF